MPRLHSLLGATARGQASIDSYELDLRRDGQATRRLVVNAHRLDYADADNIRLLVTVSDVTEARAEQKVKDDLVRDKAILMEELQHRVANSLQIIASVLLQSARQVQSDETRSQLHAAHRRVMSVAAVQKQLAGAGGGDVHLRTYLGDLCRSLGASMIHDHEQISLEVAVDGSVATANISVSLGLIVTELVINALKHAFPDGRHGGIRVEYGAAGAEWTLSVRDDGVGIPPGGKAKAGLGTSIVQALAKQLGARITVDDVEPGTAVSVTHDARAAPPVPAL